MGVTAAALVGVWAVARRVRVDKIRERVINMVDDVRDDKVIVDVLFRVSIEIYKGNNNTDE